MFVAQSQLKILLHFQIQDLVMMALAGRYAKHKGRLNKSEEDLSDTAKINYIIGASVISTIFLIFFFLSIFIASI